MPAPQTIAIRVRHFDSVVSHLERLRFILEQKLEDAPASPLAPRWKNSLRDLAYLQSDLETARLRSLKLARKESKP